MMGNSSRDRMVLAGGLAAGLLLFPYLASCSGAEIKRPQVSPMLAVSAAPTSGTSGAPIFEKVPPEENGALIPATPVGAFGSLQPYLLEIEDLLDISIYGEEDLQHVEVPIRPDGMISFAFVGDVSAAGRTVEEVRTEVTEKIGRFLRSPQVTIIAKEFSQKKVYLGGEVKAPGIYYLKGREGTLLDALFKAGLSTDKADLDGAYLVRGNKIVAADFKALVRGDLTRNVRLMDQDVVWVPEGGRRFIYVLGEVRRNDALQVSQPVPMLEVIARSGGFTNVAKRREIAVIRGGLHAPEVAVIDAKRLVEGDFSQNIMVQPGDIVYVATTGLGKYNNFVDQILRTVTLLFQGRLVSDSFNPQ